MIKHYLTLAVRNLLKYKTQNVISIIGLAVGILCFTICLYGSRFLGNVDKCFPNHKRIVQLYNYDEQNVPFSKYIGLLILLCALICGLVTLRINSISVQRGIFGGNRRRGKQLGRNVLLGVQHYLFPKRHGLHIKHYP